MRQTKKNSQGFTLIELLIVIAIIGILASTVLVNLNGARTKARRVKALQSMRSILSVAEMCVIGGGALNFPQDSGTGGGIAICNGGTEIIPNITDTGMYYCGDGSQGNCAGGWWPTGVTTNSFAIGATGSGATIVCGYNLDASGWFDASYTFNFVGTSGCKTYGF